jgi:hypothetical protein
MVLGALNTVNPMIKARAAKRSTKSLRFLKTLISYHLLSESWLLARYLDVIIRGRRAIFLLAPELFLCSLFIIRLLRTRRRFRRKSGAWNALVPAPVGWYKHADPITA